MCEFIQDKTGLIWVKVHKGRLESRLSKALLDRIQTMEICGSRDLFPILLTNLKYSVDLPPIINFLCTRHHATTTSCGYFTSHQTNQKRAAFALPPIQNG